MKKILFIAVLFMLAISLEGVVHKLGHHYKPLRAICVALYGNYAYVSNEYNSGITIFDISNAAQPESLSTFYASTLGYIRIYGDRAYVSGAQTVQNGLRILDLSDPLHPLSLGEIDMNGGKIALQGNYVYQAAWDDGLNIIDVSNPSNPTLVNQFDLSNEIRDVAIAGDFAYLAAHNGGLQILHVADPQNPQLIGQHNTPGRAASISLSGNTAYLADVYGGMHIFDISNPYSPVLLSSFNTTGFATQLTVVDNVAYVSEGQCGIQMIDVSDPTHPTPISSYDTPGSVYWTELRDGIAYLADWEEGFQILDVSNPFNNALIGELDNPFFDFSIQGDLAYLTTGAYGVDVYDISDLEAPVFCSNIDPGYLTYTDYVAVSGDLACVLGYLYGFDDIYEIKLWIVNIANPVSPLVIGTYGFQTNYPWGIKSLALQGNRVVFTNGGGLYIVDVSNPQSPALTGFYSTGHYCKQVKVLNNTAFLTFSSDGDYSTESGLLLVDISNPQTPVLLGLCTTPGQASGVSVSGTRAFVADSECGVQIVDISNPSAPFIAGNLPTKYNGDVSLCEIFNNRMYAADTNWNEVQIFDLSEPQALQLITRYAWNMPARGLFVIDNILYTGSECYGLQAQDLSAVSSYDPPQIPPNALRLVNYPNPFNPQTCIEFELPAAARTSVRIYNLKGQLVRELASAVFSKGKHSLIWDGNNAENQAVASGIYFLRLQSDQSIISRKMILAK